MKLAIVGSRGIIIEDIEKYLPPCCEIISGGAKGVDSCAAEYARKKGIKLTEILPKYELYGRAAPIIRNKEIVDCSDIVIAFWDGQSRGTQSVIKYAQSKQKLCKVILLPKKTRQT